MLSARKICKKQFMCSTGIVESPIIVLYRNSLWKQAAQAPAARNEVAAEESQPNDSSPRLTLLPTHVFISDDRCTFLAAKILH